MNVIDARWIDIRNGLYIDITGLSEARPDTHPGVWSCKNYHDYKTTELYPMRETMFEGVLAKVPYAYDKILTDEYSEQALVSTTYNGYEMHMLTPLIQRWLDFRHAWDPKSKQWVTLVEKLTMDQKAQEKRDDEEKKKVVEQDKLV
jgi:hypothetical protein